MNRRPTPEQAKAKAIMWADAGGPDDALQPRDHAAFIEAWTARFLDMDNEEFSSTGPALVPVRRGPPLRTHPDDMTPAQLRVAFDDRPWLWRQEGEHGQSLNVEVGRNALRAEWEGIHGIPEA